MPTLPAPLLLLPACSANERAAASVAASAGDVRSGRAPAVSALAVPE